MKKVGIGRAAFWLLLALPAALMLRGLSNGSIILMDLFHPSGEMAVRLMLLALLPGPLADFFGKTRFLRAWLSIRRNLGVAAFGYALLHLAFYVFDMGGLAAMLDELDLPGIWTGWISFALMLAAASISTDRAAVALGRNWKRIQRSVYLALIVGLAHWALLNRELMPALVHLAPLLVAWLLRGCARVGAARRKGFVQ